MMLGIWWRTILIGYRRFFCFHHATTLSSLFIYFYSRDNNLRTAVPGRFEIAVYQPAEYDHGVGAS